MVDGGLFFKTKDERTIYLNTSVTHLERFGLVIGWNFRNQYPISYTELMAKQDINPWKTLDSEIVYKNPHITFRKDTVSNPAGKPGEYGIVERSGGVFIVAMAADHSVCLIRQFRYPVQASTWEVPAGGIDGTENKLEAAQRELAEEAGFEADSWESLGTFFPAPGYSIEPAYVFLAQGLRDVMYEGGDADERIESKRFFSLKEVAGLMQSDTPFDGPTITAISMACVKLGLKIE